MIVRKPLTASTIFMMLALLVSALLIAGFATVLATSPVGSTLNTSESPHVQPCDTTGDSNVADDCIHTVVDSFAKGESVEPGKPFVTHVSIAPSLQGKDLIIVTQYRTVNADSTFGTWWTHKSTHWAAEETSMTTTRDLTSCAPSREGGYQMRTVLASSPSARKSHTHTPSTSQPAALVPASLYRVNTVALRQAPATPCQNSSQDLQNVEFFNMQSFTEAYTLTTASTTTDHTITLNCPQPNPRLGADLHVFVATGDLSQSADCNDGNAATSTISVPLTTSGSTPWCTSDLVCEVIVFAESSTTGTIYSMTLLNISLNTSTTLAPTLTPATLPICDSTINPCVTLGQCTVPSVKLGGLSLRGISGCLFGLSDCTPAEMASQFAYNEDVYFQASINRSVS
jgi:hypothetical protein